MTLNRTSTDDSMTHSNAKRWKKFVIEKSRICQETRQ